MLKLNLETAVGSRKYAQALHLDVEKALITNKVTTSFSNSPCTSISCTSFSRPTAVSRLKRIIQATLILALPYSDALLAHEENEILRPAQRAYHHNGWNLVASFGATFGGDELIEVEVEDDFFGDDDEDVRAGESVVFALGAAYQFYDTPLQLQATIGYHTDGIFADNGDTDFSRKPLELLAFYAVDRHRFGIGVTHHLDPEFDVDIDFLPEDRVEFDDATGFVAQYDFRVTDFFAIGVRFTSIEYEPENPLRGPDVDGDHVGIMATFLF